MSKLFGKCPSRLHFWGGRKPTKTTWSRFGDCHFRGKHVFSRVDGIVTAMPTGSCDVRLEIDEDVVTFQVDVGPNGELVKPDKKQTIWYHAADLQARSVFPRITSSRVVRMAGEPLKSASVTPFQVLEIETTVRVKHLEISEHVRLRWSVGERDDMPNQLRLKLAMVVNRWMADDAFFEHLCTRVFTPRCPESVRVG